MLSEPDNHQWIDQYQALLDTYERMLEATVQLDWDRFFQLESHTDAALAVLPEIPNLVNDLSEDEQERIRQLLTTTLERIERIKTVVGTARQEMSAKIDNTTTQRKLENTYTSY